MTQINNNEILNGTITGASIAPELGIYDETKNYTTGDTCNFKNKEYKAIIDITGTTKGDFSKAPDITSTEWQDTSASGGLQPDYDIKLIATEDINIFDEISMDVNGRAQKYPATGGNTETTYTTRTVDVHALSYIGTQDIIVMYSDTTITDKIFVRRGIIDQNTGVIAWQVELELPVHDKVIGIKSTPVDGTYLAFSVVHQNGDLRVILFKLVGTADISASAWTLPGNATNVTMADITYQPNDGHLVSFYLETSNKGYINYCIINGDGSLSVSGKTGIEIVNNATITDLECIGFNSETIACAWREGDSLVMRSATFDGGGFLPSKKYDRLSGYVHPAVGTALSLGGLTNNGNNYYVQVEDTADNWQTYYGTYDDKSIANGTKFGGTIPGDEAELVNSSSGIGYSVIHDNNYYKIYQGNAANPSAGMSLVYTDTVATPNSGVYNMMCFLVGQYFCLSMNGDQIEHQKIRILDSNKTRTDHYIGNAAASAQAGELVPIHLGLPIIKHNYQYAVGDVFVMGPYKYQAVKPDEVVIIIEATTMP